MNLKGLERWEYGVVGEIWEEDVFWMGGEVLKRMMRETVFGVWR